MKKHVKGISVLLAAVIVIGVLAWLALWTGNYKESAGNQTSKIIDSIISAEAKGGTLELTSNDLNGITASIFNKPKERNGIIINGVYMEMNNNNISIHIHAKVKGVNLLLSSTGTLWYDSNNVIYSVATLKLGKLPLPKNFILGMLKKYTGEYLAIDGDKIEIGNDVIPVNLKNLYVKGDKLVIEIQGRAITPASGTKTDTNKTNTSKSQNTSSQSSKVSTNTAAMTKISNQLNTVISVLKTPQEKQMISKMQTVINAMIKDPNYSYQRDASTVKAWYSSLPDSQKSDVKNAIMNNVDIADVIRLVKMFGL